MLWEVRLADWRVKLSKEKFIEVQFVIDLCGPKLNLYGNF
jgi:hypothetical protein